MHILPAHVEGGPAWSGDGRSRAPPLLARPILVPSQRARRPRAAAAVSNSAPAMDAPPILSARLRSRFHCRAQPDARRGEAPRGFRTVQSRCAKGHDPGANVQVWDAHASTLPVRLGSLTGGDQSGRLPHVLLLCHGADIAGHRRQLLGHGQGPGLPRRQLCWRGHGRTGRAGRGRARPMRGRALRARRETSVPAEGARGHLWGAPALSALPRLTRIGSPDRLAHPSPRPLPTYPSDRHLLPPCRCDWCGTATCCCSSSPPTAPARASWRRCRHSCTPRRRPRRRRARPGSAAPETGAHRASCC